MDEDDTVEYVLKKNPDTILLIACTEYSGIYFVFMSHLGGRTNNADNREEVVEILKKYGLRLTPEEQALVDGTSELYEVAKETEDD